MRRLAILFLLLAGWAAPARAQDEADQAWRAGNLGTAERLYEARLAADSSDQRALHRLALIRAYAERYDESLALFDRLLRLAPENREAVVDRARVLAWRGDPGAAAAALDPLLAADPAYLPALQARAQFSAWAGRYDDALAAYGRVQEITPGDRSIGYERARVLSWASRFGAARAVYDSLLRANPNDREALIGLAQVLAWSSELDAAEAVYRRVLANDPDDPDALRGLARAAAWGGRLREAERRWRQVLERQPNDAAALVGLSQTLRWQGRDAAALEAARRAVQIAPTDRDAQEELRWARLPTEPRVAPSFTYESDSDGNRIATATSGAAWRPTARVEVRGDAYYRDAGVAGRDSGGVADRTARGAGLTLWTQLEPGWSLTAGVGASETDRPGGETEPTWRASVSTPARYSATATLSYARSLLDYTALLILNGVEMDEVSLAGQLSPAGAGVVFSAGLGWAEFRGDSSNSVNHRAAANLAATVRLARYFTVGAATRAFGFTRDLQDGYFDPDLYVIREALGRYNQEWRRWAVGAEVAPGLQQVGAEGDPTTSLRATGSLSYLFGPGRRVGVSAAYANAGLSRLSPTDAGEGYRYTAVTVSGNWTF
ncbi:MAG TPA: tetratricopeptide repeat protein [Longimicrobium sp.]|nr:tetratricopeptide repeat protein [Longimicrobium sp.]